MLMHRMFPNADQGLLAKAELSVLWVAGTGVLGTLLARNASVEYGVGTFAILNSAPQFIIWLSPVDDGAPKANEVNTLGF